MSGLPLFCFPDFVFSGGWRLMREPLIRVILRYFEVFRVNLSSAFTIQPFQFTILCPPFRGKSMEIPLHKPFTRQTRFPRARPIKPNQT
jgi:hypothetical protein